MAFLGQCCTRNCLSSKNSFTTFSISKPCKARQLRNMVTNQHSTSFRPTFHQLSPGAKKHSRIIFQNSKEYRWRLCGSDDGSCGIAPFSPQIPSAVDVIEKFYKAINSEETEKLDEKLDQILSDHCAYQDLFFYIPFEGKQVFYFLFSSSVFFYSLILNANVTSKLLKKCMINLITILKH